MFNKKILITSGAILVSAAVGVPLVLTASGMISNTPTTKDTANIVISRAVSTGTTSSYTSSSTSSKSLMAQYATLNSSSGTSSQSDATSTPTSIPTDNTAARNSALASETTRHNSALASIDSQYDPQIQSLQAEISGFQAEGARDTTADIAKLQSDYDNAQAYYDKLSSYTPETQQNCVNAKNTMLYYGDQLTQQKPILQSLMSDYQKEQSDIQSLTNLQTAKNTATATENTAHNTKVETIQILFP